MLGIRYSSRLECTGQAVGIVRFLAQRLAHAHPYGPFDLTLDRQWVDCKAAIKRCPDLFNRNKASVRINDHLDNLRGITEAHGRSDRATPVLAALRLGRAGEGSLDGDRTRRRQERR